MTCTTGQPSTPALPGARRPARPLAGVAAFGAAVLLSGCGLLGTTSQDPSPEPVDGGTLLDKGTTAVDLDPGESVQVSLGEGSQGVGDSWGVISQTDDAVAEADVVMDEEVGTADGSEDAPGSSMPYAVELTGLEAGTTTVRVLYCTRAEIAEDCDQSKGTLDPPVDPVEITVTVH